MDTPATSTCASDIANPLISSRELNTSGEHGIIPGEIWLDKERQIVFMVQSGPASADGLLWALERALKLLAICERRRLLVDISRPSATVPSNARKKAAKVMEKIVLEKQAFVVQNPIVRMLALTMFKLSRQKHPIKFFTSQKEAVAWLEQL